MDADSVNISFGAEPRQAESRGGLDEEKIKGLFATFITTFRRPESIDPLVAESGLFSDPNAASDAAEDPFYMQQLRNIFESIHMEENSQGVFRIDMGHLGRASPTLLRAVIRYPADVIVFMDEVLASIINREYSQYGISVDHLPFKVALVGHPHVRCTRDLDPKDIETLIALRGIVIRCSSIIPDMRVAVFRCANRVTSAQPMAAAIVCGHEEAVALSNGEVQEPLLCDRCQGKYSFELFHARCQFGNKQLLKLQETPESIPEGETPQTVLAYVYDELVDACKPGDFVEVTAIFRAAGVRVLPRIRSLKSIYRTFLDVNSIYKDHLNRYLLDEASLEGPAVDAQLDEEMKVLDDARARSRCRDLPEATLRKLRAIGSDPNVYEKLVASVAPNIWESDDVKKGLLCQLFGGSPKVVGGRSTRSDIHVLLCGDPSTAKSQLLKYIHGIAPRGVYTCGKGSSAVGLTASVARDPESRDFILESGAIILSDRGVCCIDEFDKMDDSARIILHEVMEQQSVSIAKAGIVCSLNARTAILASANPINSRYDTRRSVVENINLPATLMSRFDLIYLMLDRANETLDRALAQHICHLYAVGRNAEVCKPPLDRATFAEYISYAREHCHPKLTSNAKKLLVEAYVRLRRRGLDAGSQTVTATPRQLESLVRISEALAKMELHETVEAKHVNEAVRLIEVATYSALVDPATGRLDFDQLNAGISGSSRARREEIETLLLTYLSTSTQGLDKAILAGKISEQLAKNNEYPVDAEGREFNMMLRELEEFGKIVRMSGGKIIRRSTTS